MDDEALKYYNSGKEHFELKEYDAAIADFTTAISLKADFAEAYHERGHAKIFIKLYPEAILDFDKAISLKPDFALAYYYRGYATAMMEAYALAINDFTTAIDIGLGPKEANAYNHRGYAKSKISDYNGAIVDYNLAIEKDPSRASYYHKRGFAKSEIRDYNGAIADYDLAIEKDPSDAWYYNNRGFVKSKIGDYIDAITDYSIAIDLEPFNYAFYFNRQLDYWSIGKYKDALKDLEQALHLTKENGDNKLFACKADYLIQALSDVVKMHAVQQVYGYPESGAYLITRTEAYRNYYRSLYLVAVEQQKTLPEVIIKLINFFALSDEGPKSPLAIFNLMEIDDLPLALDYLRAYDSAYQAQMLLNNAVSGFAQNNSGTATEVYRALLHFLYADPVTCYAVLDKLDEEDINPDPQHLYYQLASAYDILHPEYEGLKRFTLHYIEQWQGAQHEDAQQLYYAGLIYNQTGDYIKAAKCFRRLYDTKHLPGTYMYLASLVGDNKVAVQERQKVIKEILEIEQEQASIKNMAGNGFLVGWHHQLDDGMALPDFMAKCITYREISAGVALVYDYLQNKRQELALSMEANRKREGKAPLYGNKYEEDVDKLFKNTWPELNFVDTLADHAELLHRLRQRQTYDFEAEIEHFKETSKATSKELLLTRVNSLGLWGEKALAALLAYDEADEEKYMAYLFDTFVRGELRKSNKANKRQYLELLQYLYINERFSDENYYYAIFYLNIIIKDYLPKRSLTESIKWLFNKRASELASTAIDDATGFSETANSIMDEYAEEEVLGLALAGILSKFALVLPVSSPHALVMVGVKYMAKRLTDEKGTMQDITYGNFKNNELEHFVDYLLSKSLKEQE